MITDFFTPEALTILETRDIPTIHELAHAIWHPTYKDILSQEQIAFMLQEIYSPEALQKQMEEGQVFLLVQHGDTPAAFAAYSPLDLTQQLYKLNKLYIHPHFQGKGLGKLLLEEVIQRVRTQGGSILELNVHRKNPAFHFYQKHGFQIFETKDIPFGQFTLNDYIMHLNLS